MNFDRMNLECNSLRGTGTYKGCGYETISILKYVISLKSKTQTRYGYVELSTYKFMVMPIHSHKFNYQVKKYI